MIRKLRIAASHMLTPLIAILWTVHTILNKILNRAVRKMAAVLVYWRSQIAGDLAYRVRKINNEKQEKNDSQLGPRKGK